MVLFRSFSDIQLYTAIAVAVLLWYGTGRQPLVPVCRFARLLAGSRKFLLFFAALFGALMINTQEVKLEAKYGVAYDLTKSMTGWEGAWQAHLQSWLQSGVLTAVCAFFYVVVFQSVLIASLGIYADRSRLRTFYAFCTAVLLNYAIALPMYWFVPVNEAWFTHHSIRFLMLDAFPSFELDYRGLSGLNNCFPSLHTSISLTMALVALRSGNRRWASFVCLNAAVIVFSIFYLGIHWFTDALGGVVTAFICAWAGLKVGQMADRGTSSGEADEVEAEMPVTSSAHP